MDIQAYLNRVHYQGPVEPTAGTLAGLQRAHLLAVPFENLDIHLGRPIQLDEAALFDKIVRRKRGGFCYELNSLFAHLLIALGYQVTLLSAASVREDGGYDPDFDHLTLQVICPGHPEILWLADVGWGDGALEPVSILERGVQDQGKRIFKIHEMDGGLILSEWIDAPGESSRWLKHYRFTLLPRRIDEFFGMCRFHQSPASTFWKKKICTLFTPDGRVTLSNNRLIVTRNGSREEREVSDAERELILKDVFGMDMS